MDVRRWMPLSGIVFVALVLLAVVVLSGEHPESDASGAEVLAFYDAENVRQTLAAMVLAAAAPFIVFFALSLGAFLFENDKRSLWEMALVGGSVLTAGAAIAGGWIHFALADGAEAGVSAEAMQALNVLDSDVWLPLTTALGVMMLGAAGALLTSTGLPRWLGGPPWFSEWGSYSLHRFHRADPHARVDHHRVGAARSPSAAGFRALELAARPERRRTVVSRSPAGV